MSLNSMDPAISVVHNVQNVRQESVVYCEGCPSRPYVELQVPSSIQHVQKLVIRTNSRDQGFSNEDEEFRGTYQHSFSWFDVDVLKPSGHRRVSRRRLQHNMHAEGTMRQHVNIWDIHETKDLLLKEWLQSIRPDDVVQVIPFARHPGWRNFVDKVEIEIHGNSSGNNLGVPPLAARLLASTQGVRTKHTASIMHPLQNELEEIRLLILNPGSGEEPLSGTLTRISLLDTSRPQFQCLSYCWGDLKDTTSIKLSQEAYVSGRRDISTSELIITANLASALFRLRLQESARVLWIDAICIDQDNPQERAEQVAKLRGIYALAQSVIVWLGSSNEVIDEDIRASKKVMKHYTQNRNSNKDQSNSRYQGPHTPLFKDGDAYNVDSPILANEFFYRAWVVQEVYLGKTVSVVCGDQTLPWSVILRINECLHATMRNTLVPLHKNVIPRSFASLFKLDDDPVTLETTRGYQTINDRPDVLDVVIGGLDLDTSDPRDKLFALLSFGNETSDIASLPSEIMPNYTKTPEIVFADFTRWWVIKYKSLKILSTVHVSQGRTWVRTTSSARAIDFQNRPSWCIWHDGRSVWSQAILAFHKTYLWNASAGTALDSEAIRVPRHPTILHLKGRRIGRIESLQHYPFWDLYEPLQCYALEPWLWNKERAETYGEMSEIFKYIFDPGNQRGTWSSSIQRETDARLLDFQSIRANMGDHFRSHATREKIGILDCHDPCFLRTETGCVGLCPHQAKVGDEVVVLYGGTVPLILRQLEGETTTMESRRLLIGECYINDYMHGRAITERLGDADKFKEEIFALV